MYNFVIIIYYLFMCNGERKYCIFLAYMHFLLLLLVRKIIIIFSRTVGKNWSTIDDYISEISMFDPLSRLLINIVPTLRFGPRTRPFHSLYWKAVSERANYIYRAGTWIYHTRNEWEYFNFHPHSFTVGRPAATRRSVIPKNSFAMTNKKKDK